MTRLRQIAIIAAAPKAYAADVDIFNVNVPILVKSSFVSAYAASTARNLPLDAVPAQDDGKPGVVIDGLIRDKSGAGGHAVSVAKEMTSATTSLQATPSTPMSSAYPHGYPYECYAYTTFCDSLVGLAWGHGWYVQPPMVDWDGTPLQAEQFRKTVWLPAGGEHAQMQSKRRRLRGILRTRHRCSKLGGEGSGAGGK